MKKAVKFIKKHDRHDSEGFGSVNGSSVNVKECVRCKIEGMGWQKGVSGWESEGVSFHGKGVRCRNGGCGREMENQNWHHDYEITFGELTSLGGSVPHHKKRVWNDGLWGI